MTLNFPAIIGSLLRYGRYVTSWRGIDFDAVLGEVSPVVNRMGRTLPCGKNSSLVMARQDF